MLVTKVNNNGGNVWSTKIGDSHKTSGQKSYSIGFAIDEVVNMKKNVPLYDLKINRGTIIRLMDFCTLALVFGRKVPVFRNPLL